MRVLITGASGLIGGRVARCLAAAGHHVVVTSRNTANRGLPEGLPSVGIELDDNDSLDRACNQIDVVVHAAGMNAADCQRDPEGAFHVNAIGTGRLAVAAQRGGARKFIYLSTAHVYASPLAGTISEAIEPTNPHPYAASHLAGEVEALAAGREGGMDVIVLRLSNAFGAPVSPQANCWMLVANDLCRQWAESNTLRLATRGNQERDFITLAGVAQAIERLIAIDCRSTVCNLGGQSWMVLDLARRIQARAERIGGALPPLTLGDGGAGEAAPLIYRTDRLHELVGSLTQDYDAEIDALLLFCRHHFGAGR